jgi:glycosyltransferase involved in cell wall biosynthesis
LFATADSATTAALASTAPHGWSEDPDIDPKVAECLHIASVFERADEFDVIHNGFDFLPLTYSALVTTPVITTIHGFSSPRILDVYERYDTSTTYVAISDADRHPRLHYAATIHHGIDVGAFAVDPAPGDHLLFFGRIHPDKGTAAAIAVARACGRTLVIAGIVQDREYFEREVAPHLGAGDVLFVGAVDAGARASMLAGAHALLHLIDFDEPFGFSVAEALASGTPVIAFRRGSMDELLRDGENGFLVRTVVEAADAVERVGTLDRAAIRADAVVRFDVATMVDRYVDVYRQIM